MRINICQCGEPSAPRTSKYGPAPLLCLVCKERIRTARRRRKYVMTDEQIANRRARVKERRKQNPEPQRESTRRWRATSPLAKLTVAQWMAANPDVVSHITCACGQPAVPRRGPYGSHPTQCLKCEREKRLARMRVRLAQPGVRQQYRKTVPAVCPACHKDFISAQGTVCCSKSCAARLRGGPPKGPLRQAIELENNNAILEYISSHSVSQPSGCKLWLGPCNSNGYPVTGKSKLVHRVVAEAIHGPLPGIAVHHKCAVRMCVNADHLEPVTHAENTAEMLERQGLKARIAYLESQLQDKRAS